MAKTVVLFAHDPYVVFFLLFNVDHFLKVFIEFVTTLLLFYALFCWPQGMWDLSSPTRDRTHTPCIGKRSLNQWKHVKSLCFPS